MEQAKNWLEKAFKLSDPQKIKLMALDGSDLKAVVEADRKDRKSEGRTFHRLLPTNGIHR